MPWVPASYASAPMAESTNPALTSPGWTSPSAARGAPSMLGMPSRALLVILLSPLGGGSRTGPGFVWHPDRSLLTQMSCRRDHECLIADGIGARAGVAGPAVRARGQPLMVPNKCGTYDMVMPT